MFVGLIDSLKRKQCRQHFVKVTFEEKEVDLMLKERHEMFDNLLLVGNRILKATGRIYFY